MFIRIVCFLAFALSVCIPLSASAFASRTESWSEDALLHDGRIVKVSREVGWTFQLFYGDGGSPGMFGSWPDKFWLKFEQPDTHETIKWQGEQYYNPILLDIIDGIPYLVVYGMPNKGTEKIYGCPELPYVYLKYEKGFFGKWIPISVEHAPIILKEANLSPEYPEFGRMFPGDETAYQQKHGRPSRDLSHEDVLKKMGAVSQHSGGFFQARVPRSYDEWNYSGKKEHRYERRHNDCRPPPVKTAPSPKFEAAKLRIDAAELRAKTVNAAIESFSTDTETVSKDDFLKARGVWTGTGYLSGKCSGIVKTIEPIREYEYVGSSSGWHLVGFQIVLNSGEEIPMQQSNLPKYRAPALLQTVVCENDVIHAVIRGGKEGLTIYRFTYSGEVIDVIKVALPDIERVVQGNGWGDVWGLNATKNRLAIDLVNYTYTSTANYGGTISKKQRYIVKMPP